MRVHSLYSRGITASITTPIGGENATATGIVISSLGRVRSWSSLGVMNWRSLAGVAEATPARRIMEHVRNG